LDPGIRTGIGPRCNVTPDVITDRLAPLLKRDPATLRGRVCVGPAGMCAELLSGFAEAGCGRVHFWPLGAEGRQVDLIASKVLPGVRP
jgi:hypothetical protein